MKKTLYQHHNKTCLLYKMQNITSDFYTLRAKELHANVQLQLIAATMLFAF